MPTTATTELPTIATSEKDLALIHRALYHEREWGRNDPQTKDGLDKIEKLREDHITLLDAIEACYDLLCKSRVSARDRAYLIVQLDLLLQSSGRRCHEPEQKSLDLFTAESPASSCPKHDLR